MEVGQHWPTGGLKRAVALPALTAALVRALIPIGFMPASVHGTIELVFCDGGGHHQADGSRSDYDPANRSPAGHHGVDQGPCPFALSVAPPLLAASMPDMAAAVHADELAVAAPAALVREAPPRFSTPRGPPALV